MHGTTLTGTQRRTRRTSARHLRTRALENWLSRHGASGRGTHRPSGRAGLCGWRDRARRRSFVYRTRPCLRHDHARRRRLRRSRNHGAAGRGAGLEPVALPRRSPAVLQRRWRNDCSRRRRSRTRRRRSRRRGGNRRSAGWSHGRWRSLPRRRNRRGRRWRRRISRGIAGGRRRRLAALPEAQRHGRAQRLEARAPLAAAGGATASFCCVIAFNTSPGREMCDKSILVLISSSPRSGRADRAEGVALRTSRGSAPVLFLLHAPPANWNGSSSPSPRRLQHVENSFAFNFQLPGEIVDSNLAHPAFLVLRVALRSSLILTESASALACDRNVRACHDYSVVSGAEPSFGPCSSCFAPRPLRFPPMPQALPLQLLPRRLRL